MYDNPVKGDYVRVRPGVSSRAADGVRGRVYYTYANNVCPDTDAWLERREYFGPEPMRFVNATWVAILIEGVVDARTYPVDVLEKVEPFRLSNQWETLYFTPREIMQ